MKYTFKEKKERFFIGLEYEGGVSLEGNNDFGDVWHDLFDEKMIFLDNIETTNNFIGLECYPPDFKESKTFDYYALVETKKLEKVEGFISKKLPKGKYICFRIKFDEAKDEIRKVYNYIKENDIKVHMGFDYEQYLDNEKYDEKGAVLDFCLLLEND